MNVVQNAMKQSPCVMALNIFARRGLAKAWAGERRTPAGVTACEDHAISALYKGKKDWVGKPSVAADG